jgi:ribosomal-protein-alanine N-acetyltransferase
MLIRKAVRDDIPQIIRLAGQSATAAHWSAGEYDALFAPEAPKRITLVACDEWQPEIVTGFVIARAGTDEWEIENVVVNAASRQQGIGQLLIRDVMRHARHSGAPDIFLEVRESNAAARALYARLGFREAGRRRTYYSQPDEDALVLRKQL